MAIAYCAANIFLIKIWRQSNMEYNRVKQQANKYYRGPDMIEHSQAHI